MALMGKAAVAMWWNMAPAQRSEFEDWHSHEHFPERMGIPGFLRGSRWSDANGGEGFFVIYELDEYRTLTSDGYRAKLNNPTPWSTKMMPHHRDMVRSQCHVIESMGGGIARYALTLRLSPSDGAEESLRSYLTHVGSSFVTRPGGVACHLLRTETPQIADTREQKIRGGDAAADWILVALGYDQGALEALWTDQFQASQIESRGAQTGAIAGLYELAHAASSSDLHTQTKRS